MNSSKNSKKINMKKNQSENYDCKDFLTSGFKAAANKSDVTLAFVSLRIALSAYFSTYKQLRDYKGRNPNDICNNLKYYELYTETIIHFQHFFELLIKDVLRSENELFAAKIGKAHGSSFEALVSVTKGLSISQTVLDNLFSIEFDEALKRLKHIIIVDTQKRKIQHAILSGKNEIETLTSLRNKTWHRGAYFLSLAQLDSFICKSILPVIIRIQKTNYYKNMIHYIPNTQKSDINVILELISCHKNGKHLNTSKISLLKEIGRSTYASPFSNYYKAIKKEKKSKPKVLLIQGKPARFSKASAWLRLFPDRDGEYSAKAIAGEKQSHVTECPVCGQKSLLVLLEWSDYEEGNYSYVPEVECKTCTFNIHSDINLSRKPYKIPNYFK